MPLPEKKPLYLSLETDGEFRARIEKKHGVYLYSTGDELDKKAWDWFSVQRKLVERG